MRLGGIRLLGPARESLPSFDEVEVFVVGGAGIDFAEVFTLNGDLGVDESGFEGDEAGLTPVDGGELVDEGAFRSSPEGGKRSGIRRGGG